MSLENKIVELRKEKLTYEKIKNKLNCSYKTVSHYCKINNLDGNYINSKFHKKIDNELISKMNNYYKEHTMMQTCEKFNICKTTLLKYVDRKFINLTETERKEKKKKAVVSFRQRLKKRAVEYKGGSCEKCGYNKSVWSMSFHHLNSKEKDFSISGKSWKWEKVKKELDKCILVCNNCHGEIHEKESNEKVKQ